MHTNKKYFFLFKIDQLEQSHECTSMMHAEAFSYIMRRSFTLHQLSG